MCLLWIIAPTSRRALMDYDDDFYDDTGAQEALNEGMHADVCAE